MHNTLTLNPNRSMSLPKAFYFFHFAAMSSLIPFLSLHYAQIGLTGRQIGLLAGMLPLITLVSASFWGGLADATHQHRRILVLAICGTLMAVALLAITSSFHWLLPVVALYALVSAPIIPLVDNTVLALLGERRNEYGRQRLWGALGWGVAAPISGAMIDQVGLQWAFFGFLILMFGGLLVSVRIPVTRASLGGQFWHGLRLLVTNTQWIVFLVSVLIGFLGLSMTVNFLFLHMSNLGASKTLMGVSLTVATLSELPVWFFSNRMLERWGAKGVLILALLASATQAFGFSLIQDPWLVLPIQLLHGPVFSAMWAAGVYYANENAPAGMGATTQGLFASVAMGMRSGIGALLGGVLYDSVGASAMFRWGGVFALVGLVIFVASGSRASLRRRTEGPLPS